MTDGRTHNSFTPGGIQKFIQSTPTLTGMTIYLMYNQFTPARISKLKELLDSRGGQGLIVLEEGDILSVSVLTSRGRT